MTDCVDSGSVCKTVAILLAAGSGSRLKSEHKSDKQFRPLAGMPLYLWPLSSLALNHNISKIILVTKADNIALVWDEVNEFTSPIDAEIAKSISIVAGGASRPHSTYLGLEAVKAHINSNDTSRTNILIHDAARAFLTQDVINSLHESKRNYDCAIPALPVTDTVKRITIHNDVLETLPRQELVAVQTPQLCSYQLLCNAFETIDLMDPTLTDDASIMENAGYRVCCIKGDRRLFKITNPGDFDLMERIMSETPLF